MQEKSGIKGTQIEDLSLSSIVSFLIGHDVYKLLLNVVLSKETLQS